MVASYSAFSRALIGVCTCALESGLRVDIARLPSLSKRDRQQLPHQEYLFWLLLQA